MASRSEARVFTSIWDDEAFIALPPGQQRMYLFLLSQKDLSYCGLIHLRERLWARKAAGLTADQVNAALQGLAEPFPEGLAQGLPEGSGGPLVVMDEDTEEIFVRSLIRHDGIWKIPNLLKSAREAATLIESPVILAALLAELRRIPVDESGSQHVKRTMADFIMDLEHRLAKGSANPCANPSGKGSANPSANGSSDPSQGKGEGNGSREGESPYPCNPGSPEPPRAPARGTPLANGLLDEHLAACNPKPNRMVVAQTGDAIDRLLGDPEVTPDMIRAGLELMRTRVGKGPGLLPNLVDEARAAAAASTGGSPRASPGHRPPYEGFKNPNPSAYRKGLK